MTARLRNAPADGRPRTAARRGHEPDRPAPEFEILGVRARRRAAAPTLRFSVGQRRLRDREVYTIALTGADRDRAREAHATTTRPASDSSSSSASPSAGRRPRAASLDQVDVAGPGFTGAPEFELEVPCTYDLEVAATKYFGGLADGEAPLRFHFTGSVFYAATRAHPDRPDPVGLLGRFAMPVEVWKRDDRPHYPAAAGSRCTARRSSACARCRRAGLPTFDAAVGELLDGAGGR